MANIDPKSGKKSTRVDMTAMVDVAFLLLTFFILTTTLTSPLRIDLVKAPRMENGTINSPRISGDKIMTLILGEDDKVHYYQGVADHRPETTDYSPEGLREVIQAHLTWGGTPCYNHDLNCWDPIFIVKPNATSHFKNLVDALDELRIAGARKFSYQEKEDFDRDLLAVHDLK